MNRSASLLIVFVIVAAVLSAGLPNDVARAHISMHGMDNQYNIISEDAIVRDGDTVCYIYHLSPIGFIAVSSMQNMRPILGYSFESDIELVAENPAYDFLVNSAKKRYALMQSGRQDIAKVIERNRRIWEEYITRGESLLYRILDGEEYGPWLLTYWHQGGPYNRYCPEDPETGRRSMTGCVATATAMIMNYWDFPYSIELTDEDSYYSYYTDPPIFVDATTADLDTIIYTGYRGFEPDPDMKGRLCFATGVILDMSYSSSGSGTNNFAWRFTEDFGFSNATDVERIFEEPVPIDNMRNGRPMYVSLIGETYGHAVVADGWRETGEFHVNMGWGGGGNGWFAILDDEMPGDFVLLNKLILDIYAPQHEDFPDTRETAKEITILDSLGKVTNGIILYDDVDYLKFYANPESTYQFYTTGPLDTYCEIYDSLGDSPIAYSDTGGSFENFWISFRPEFGQPGYYYIKIGDLTSLSLVNYKLFFRRVIGEGPYLRMFQPDGDEVLSSTDSVNITFSLYSIPYGTPIILDYSTSGRYGPWTEIASDITTFSYRWSPPEFEEDQYNCFIRAKVDGYSHVYDINEEPFTIEGTESISENQAIPEKLKLRAYPNPFNSAINIDLDKESSIKIIDNSGKIIAAFDMVESVKWQPNHFVESGIYTIIVNDDPETSHRIAHIK
ncbi:MAG: C10 family peptidase [Candidatus Zixiibacteriota bacterium]